MLNKNIKFKEKLQYDGETGAVNKFNDKTSMFIST